MNDWDEYAAGFRIAKEIISQEFPEHIEALEEIAPERMDVRFMVLICSFSNTGDCLSMWRGYGGNGQGAVIGYDPETIKMITLGNRYVSTMSPVSGNVLFYPVIYDKETYRLQVRSYIQRIFANNQTTPKENMPLFLKIRHRMLQIALMRLCTLYKNDFFIDEREVRGFIEINEINDPYDLKERLSDFGQAIYHKINIKQPKFPAIKEVIMGPLCTLAIDSIQEKLHANGLSNVIIKKSRGTYR